jgi:hypothetical protein
MTPNKRDLKAYSRFDGTGRIVPGSTVLRRNKPKNGNWKETQAYECCNSSEGCVIPEVTVSTIATGFPYDTSGCTIYVRFKCNNITIWEISGLGFPIPTDLEEFIYGMNLLYGWLGTWTFDGTTVTLVMNGGVANALCSTGELTMSIGISCPA